MRLAWLTDVHLNFIDALTMERFFGSVAEGADTVAISGDLAESHDVYHYLRRIEEIVEKPIYFVLGNHDFYRGSIAQVRRFLDKRRLWPILTALGDEAAQHFERVLEAASEYPNVIAVTHVPPFREAAWYRGKTSDDNFLPYFASKAVGDVMRKVMQAHPKSSLLVLCGHTHGGGEIKVLDNLRVLTREAECGKLRINAILTVE